MNGVLVVDKPLGPTSHDVVARVRRLIGVRRLGHTGTLDPLATGVLPLVVGRATRLATFFSGSTKEYVADVRFGASTVTYDSDPRIVRDPVTGLGFVRESTPREPAGLTAQAIETALAGFRGTTWQVPPAFSAKKVDGVPAHKRARRRQPIALRPVSVTVHAIAFEGYGDGLARIRLACSAGFYVRSFAHDLGQLLGCGAYLEGLRRTRAGDFTLHDAVGLDRLEEMGGAASVHLIPLNRLLLDLPSVVLTERGARRASHGNTVSAEDVARADQPSREGSTLSPAEDGAARFQRRLLDASGTLLGIAEQHESGLLHPVIVLV